MLAVRCLLVTTTDQRRFYSFMFMEIAVACFMTRAVQCAVHSTYENRPPSPNKGKDIVRSRVVNANCLLGERIMAYTNGNIYTCIIYQKFHMFDDSRPDNACR